MRIILNQREIEDAVTNELLSQVNIADDVQISVELKATRKGEGFQAFVQIGAANEVVETTPTANDLGIGAKVEAAKKDSNRPRGRGRPPGSKNKPKDMPITEEAPQSADGLIAIPAVEPVAEQPVEALNPEPEAPVMAPAESVAELIEAVEEGQVEASAPTENPEPVAAIAEPVLQDAAIEQQKEETVAEKAPEPEAPQSAPAPEVQAADVSTQATEALAANMTETEAEQAAAQESAPTPAPARSLFANLSDPKAG